MLSTIIDSCVPIIAIYAICTPVRRWLFVLLWEITVCCSMLKNYKRDRKPFVSKRGLSAFLNYKTNLI